MLDADQLVACAGKAQLTPVKWLALLQASKARPAVFSELPARREEIPPEPVTDPFVSALRRLAWPSGRLPERHRRAIAAFGEAPLSLLRLALEEARTRGWRELDARSLGKLVRWLAKLPWEAKEIAAHAALAARGRAYLAYCLNAVEPDLASRRQRLVFHEMLDYSKLRPFSRAGHEVEGERLLATALYYSKCLARRQAGDALGKARQHFENSGSEEHTHLALVRAWVDGEYFFDPERAEALMVEALEKIGYGADPWLAFFIRHEAARITVRQGRRAYNTHLFLRGGSFEKAIELGRAWVNQQPGEMSAARAAALRRTHRHLEAAAPLVGEFESTALRLRRLWFWGLAVQVDEPEEGLRYLTEALELARMRPDRWCRYKILEDLLFFRERAGSPREE